MKQFMVLISQSLVLAGCSISVQEVEFTRPYNTNILAGKTYLAPMPEQLIPYAETINVNSKEINDLVLLYPMTYTFLSSGIFTENPAQVTSLWSDDLKPSRYYFDEEKRVILIRHLNTDRGRKDIFFRGRILNNTIVITERRKQGSLIWHKEHEILTLQK